MAQERSSIAFAGTLRTCFPLPMRSGIIQCSLRIWKTSSSRPRFGASQITSDRERQNGLLTFSSQARLPRGGQLAFSETDQKFAHAGTTIQARMTTEFATSCLQGKRQDVRLLVRSACLYVLPRGVTPYLPPSANEVKTGSLVFLSHP